MPGKEVDKPNITITIDGKTEEFDNLYRACYFINSIRWNLEKQNQKQKAEDIYNNVGDDVKFITQVKTVLENKFGIWVAKSKHGTFNLRKDGRPVMFSNKKMFGLTKEELIKFYHRYCKVVILE
jgi:hypothetical protein